MAQGWWLLTVYIFLCLMRRAPDALICRNCMSAWPLAPCIPLKATCHVHNGVCVTLEIYGEKRLEKFMLSCTEKDVKRCGTTWNEPKTKLKYKYNCCSNQDRCNMKPWIRPWKKFSNPEGSHQGNKNSSDPFVAGSSNLIQNLADNTNCNLERELTNAPKVNK